MTDPKPATPATDQEIAAWQHDCYTRSACDHGQFGPCLEQNLFARIAADAEKLRAAEQHHRDMLTAVGEEATRQLAAKDEEIERWKELHGNDERCIQNQFTELATLREQVGVLKEENEIMHNLMDYNTGEGGNQLDPMKRAITERQKLNELKKTAKYVVDKQKSIKPELRDGRINTHISFLDRALQAYESN